MKVLYTEQAIQSLEEALSLIKGKASEKTIKSIVSSIFNQCEKLSRNPNIGRTEKYLEHLGLDHRRIIEGNYKIIYRVVRSTIYITDIFDTRQDPKKMKA